MATPAKDGADKDRCQNYHNAFFSPSDSGNHMCKYSFDKPIVRGVHEESEENGE
jgi:hypothetical protein